MSDVIDRIDALIKRYGTDLQVVIHPDDLPEMARRFGPRYSPESENIMATVMGLPLVTSEFIERGTSTIMPRTDVRGRVVSDGPVSIEDALAGFAKFLKERSRARA